MNKEQIGILAGIVWRCFVVSYGNGDAVCSLYELKSWSLKILGNRFENQELLGTPNPAKNLQVYEPIAYERSE